LRRPDDVLFTDSNIRRSRLLAGRETFIRSGGPLDVESGPFELAVGIGVLEGRVRRSSRS
jgi:hypothetical protein